MRTLLYIGQNPAAGTGSPVIVLRHLRRFAAAGWRVRVVADYGGDYADCIGAGFDVVRLCHRRWWWPPYREDAGALRWMRLQLLAREVAAAAGVPEAILGYLASHTDFTGRLAAQVARVTGAPLHMLVHDDATAFPAARGRIHRLRETHEAILRAATASWFVSPELAARYPSAAIRHQLLPPIPEGWQAPAGWRDAFAREPRVYYAGHVWPEQHPVLARMAGAAAAAGAGFWVMSRDSAALRALCASRGIRWQPPFPENPAALQHLATHAAAVVVSYADSVAAMPWSATSFPSKLVEYTHLGLPVVIVAAADTAVARWARRAGFPHCFDPAENAALTQWFAGLRERPVWETRAAVSLTFARAEFDPGRIQARLADAIAAGTECRAA